LSVILYSKKTFSAIANSILRIRESQSLIMYGEDYYDCEKFYDNDKYKFCEVKVKAWADRLFISNQLANLVQYWDHKDVSREIKRLDDKDFTNAEIWGIEKLLDQLNSIDYNLYTNAGNSFISEKDLDFLNRIVHSLEHEVTRVHFKNESGMFVSA